MSHMQHNTGSNTTEAVLLARDPNKAMQEMMDMIDDLRRIYEAETAALESSNPKSFMELQDEKLNAAHRYERGVAQILARKTEMKSVDSTLKARLEAMQKDFVEMSYKNIKAIERMQRTTSRLGDTIRNAAKQAVKEQRTVNYTESGRVNSHGQKSLSMGISETA